MFIRWQTRPRDKGKDTSHRAMLVASIRIDGEPRQQHVAYLGSYSERQFALDTAALHQARFLAEADAKLAAIPDLTVAERRALARALRVRVPAPTKREIRAAERR